MVLQEIAQKIVERQQLEAQMHKIILREIDLNKRKRALQKCHDAVTEELAIEKLHHANTRQQLSAVQQKHVAELKARLLVQDLLPILCLH